MAVVMEDSKRRRIEGIILIWNIENFWEKQKKLIKKVGKIQRKIEDLESIKGNVEIQRIEG